MAFVPAVLSPPCARAAPVARASIVVRSGSSGVSLPQTPVQRAFFGDACNTMFTATPLRFAAGFTARRAPRRSFGIFAAAEGKEEAPQDEGATSGTSEPTELPSGSFTKLAMRNMVMQGAKSLYHFTLTLIALLTFFIGIGYLTKPPGV
eukprot:tig00000718_g3702.t1